MKLKIYKNAEDAAAILARGGFGDEELANSVREIVRGVRDGGDKALFSYCEKFDGSALNAQTVAVSAEEIAAALTAGSATAPG